MRKENEIDTYEITQENIEKAEAGPKNWHEQFWVDVATELFLGRKNDYG